MKRDTVFHIVLVSIILVLSGVVFYFVSLYYSVEDTFRNSFLSGLGIFNPEFTLHDTSKGEIPVPGALHVPILIYHSVKPHQPGETSLLKRYIVEPSSFEKQLRFFKENNYTVIGLDYLAEALDQTILLPPKSIVLTFDDGWNNQYAYAFPLLKQYGYTATFFIYTNAIDHKGFLTWQQVKEMDSAGMTIGGHTKSHPYLKQVTDTALLEDEIIGGKRVLEDHLGNSITLFAYPFGYYNDTIIGIVKKAGYKTARSTYKGTYHTLQDLYKLKGIEASDDLDKLIKEL